MGAFGKLKELVRAGKDASASLVLQKVIRERLAPYGHVSDLSLDSSQKTIRVEMMLHGESEPLRVVVEQYGILEEGATVAFVIRRASASRVWVQRLIEDFVLNKPFLIPEKHAWLVKVVM